MELGQEEGVVESLLGNPHVRYRNEAEKYRQLSAGRLLTGGPIRASRKEELRRSKRRPTLAGQKGGANWV